MEMEKKVVLTCPILLPNGSEVKEIMIPRPKTRHMKLVPEAIFSGESKNPANYSPLIAALTGQPDPVIDDMDLADLVKCVEVINSFLVDSLPTGATSSQE